MHIFDVDYTVVRKTSAQYFVQMALKEGIIRFSQISHLFFDWIKYKLARPNNDFVENTVKKLAGLNKDDLERLAEICFEKRIKPNIYSNAHKIITDAVKNGEKVIFATSSFDFIIKPLERFYGINNSVSCRMEYKDNYTTGNMIGYSSFGPKKKTAVKTWLEENSINPKDVYFYSDSYTDIPLLEYCGKPVAVNPDRLLRKKAKKHKWQILIFKNVLAGATS